MARGNTENLRPLNTRTKEERTELAKKAGKASGKARRRKKELKELLELALSQPHESGEDNYMAITVALIDKALQGDTKAFEVIRDTIGQKPKDNIDVNTGQININILGDDE